MDSSFCGNPTKSQLKTSLFAFEEQYWLERAVMRVGT